MPSRTTKQRKQGKPSLRGAKISSDFRLTHPDRVVYPAVGITKGEVATYYAQVAKWMLPHVANRPLTLVRCPGGLAQSCFYQKHPPPGPAHISPANSNPRKSRNKYILGHSRFTRTDSADSIRHIGNSRLGFAN